MNEKELKLLGEYIKERFDEVDKDYKTFDGFSKIDKEITYLENKRIIAEHLDSYLPKIIPKLKRETSMNKKQEKELQQSQLKIEMEKIEAEVKLNWEIELEKIVNTQTSENLEKLYFIPNQYIEMVMKKKRKGLLLYGDGGWGKSYHIKKKLGEMKMIEGKDYVFICGHITPLQFYIKLYQARDMIVIFDDVNILESKINLNMLKASLSDNNQGRVEYHTTRAKALEHIPSSFTFNGQLIILLNDKPKNSNNLQAVETRILHYHMDFDYRNKIAILFDIAKNDYAGIELKERLEISEWIKNNTNEATENLNIRLLFMCFEFYKFNTDRWKELAGNYIQNDEYLTIIVETIKTNNLKETEKIFCEKTQLHPRTFWRYYSKLKGGQN